MTNNTYRPSDLEPLNAGIRLLDEISRMPCIEINFAGEAFTQLSSAEGVPAPLRLYYARVGKQLMDTEVRLKKYLRSTRYAGHKIFSRIKNTLGRTVLSDEEMNRLRHVSTRLQELELEKILQQKIDGMNERLDGLNPSGVEWDEWDAGEIILWLTIAPDAERPAYHPDKWNEDNNMESLQIRVTVWEHREMTLEKDAGGWMTA